MGHWCMQILCTRASGAKGQWASETCKEKGNVVEFEWVELEVCAVLELNSKEGK